MRNALVQRLTKLIARLNPAWVRADSEVWSQQPPDKNDHLWFIILFAYSVD